MGDMRHDEVIDCMCRHIVTNIEPVSVSLLDDCDDVEEPHGFNQESGGPASCTVSRRLVSANARVRCRVRPPVIPAGYQLRKGVCLCGSQEQSEDVYLFGPGIDPEDPESLCWALDVYGRELARACREAIGECIRDDYRADWLEICKKQTGRWTHSWAIIFSDGGAWLEFVIEVEEASDAATSMACPVLPRAETGVPGDGHLPRTGHKDIPSSLYPVRGDMVDVGHRTGRPDDRGSGEMNLGDEVLTPEEDCIERFDGIENGS